jgi:hypothetical protein
VSAPARPCDARITEYPENDPTGGAVRTNCPIPEFLAEGERLRQGIELSIHRQPAANGREVAYYVRKTSE